MQDGVEKEPTTWRFVLNRPPPSGYKEESGSLHTPRLTQRLEKQGKGRGGERRVRGERMGKKANLPSGAEPHRVLC